MDETKPPEHMSRRMRDWIGAGLLEPVEAWQADRTRRKNQRLRAERIRAARLERAGA